MLLMINVIFYGMALVPWPMDIIEFLERHELYCVLDCVVILYIRIESLYCIGSRHYTVLTVWIESLCYMNKMNHLC